MATASQSIKEHYWIPGIKNNDLPLIGAIGALTLGVVLSKQLPSTNATLYISTAALIAKLVMNRGLTKACKETMGAIIGMGAIVGMESARWLNRSFELLPSLEQYLPNTATNTHLLIITSALLGVIMATRSLCCGRTDRKMVDVSTSPQVTASHSQPQVEIIESDWAVEYWGKGVVIPTNKMPTTASGITNSYATSDAQHYGLVLKRLEKSFPASRTMFNSQIDLLNSLFNTATHEELPIVYSSEKLEKDCNLLMAHALEIAAEVYKDLSKWSKGKIFSQGDKPLIDGALLSSKGHWLRKGFVMLSQAYRTIYNLEEHYAVLEHLKQSLERSCKKIREDIALGKALPNTIYSWEARLQTLEKYEKNYSSPNKKALENWQNLFFTPGTKQFEWRQNYNKTMAKILELGKGAEAFLLEHGRTHDNKEYRYF